MREGEGLFATDLLMQQLEQYQTQSETLRKQLSNAYTHQANLTKNVEFLQTTNEKLRQESNTLQQKVRELQILIAMPSSEIDSTSVRADIFHKSLTPQANSEPSYRWLLLLLPIIALTVILGIKWLTPPSVQKSFPEIGKTIQARALSITDALEKQVTEMPKVLENQPVVEHAVDPLAKPVSIVDTMAAKTQVHSRTMIEPGYLVIDIPSDSLGTTRVRNGYHAKAKEVARVESGMRFRIRTQSPMPMRRKIMVNGTSMELEDYSYKISDKEQWVFGYFTNRRMYGKTQQ
ncbi:MAG: hypothetical protein RIS64_2182 [Bacteroidota bacterium]